MAQLVDGRPYVTTPQAAKRSGLTTSYLAHLCRTEQLESFRLAREWFIYSDALETFLARPRKPGPKGPRKKSRAGSEEGERAGAKQ